MKTITIHIKNEAQEGEMHSTKICLFNARKNYLAQNFNLSRDFTIDKVEVNEAYQNTYGDTKAYTEILADCIHNDLYVISANGMRLASISCYENGVYVPAPHPKQTQSYTFEVITKEELYETTTQEESAPGQENEINLQEADINALKTYLAMRPSIDAAIKAFEAVWGDQGKDRCQRAQEALNKREAQEHLVPENVFESANVKKLKRDIKTHKTPKKPILDEAFSDNGEHSHWRLIDSETGENLWSEIPEEDKARGFPVKDYREIRDKLAGSVPLGGISHFATKYNEGVLSLNIPDHYTLEAKSDLIKNSLVPFCASEPFYFNGSTVSFYLTDKRLQTILAVSLHDWSRRTKAMRY